MSALENQYNKKYIDKKYKESVGIALCRRCPKSHNLQLMMVHKRVSYSFVHFVFGKYKMEDKPYSGISRLLNEMTVNEKLQILSMNFDNLWYMIWLKIPSHDNDTYYKNWLRLYCDTNILNMNIKDFYTYCKKRYNMLISSDNGVKLGETIMKSKHVKNFLWEIPKGRINENESMINCAIRELEEETNIDPTQYKICFDIQPFIFINTYAEVKHRHIYYVATVLPNIAKTFVPEISFQNIQQITEIDNIRWLSLTDMSVMWNHIPNSNHIKNLAKKIFKTITNRKII
jgi:8-oxo-dGTP pyrophosphatase MutT (NUDIX family)